MQKRILIVDDEPSIRKVLQAHLKRSGYSTTEAPDGARAISLLHEEAFELLISDLRMPNIDGMELLGYCRSHFPGMPVILITAHGTVDSAVEAIKLGAHDYITKPFDRDELQQIISKALATEEADRYKLAVEDVGRFEIIGRAPGMHSVYSMIDKVARSPTSVLITGESGTGKELVAHAIHSNSDRSQAPFIRVNCGAIPENLFESELFGHERGAFTGAVSSRPGRFELADGGTLFLDEIGELPKDMQVKLLRVLQEQTFERVGGVRTISVDVRLIAATNRDLLSEVRAGNFREDLYYRLNVIPIHLPPLRERMDDIPLLTDHFITKFNERLEKQIKGVSPEAMSVLMASQWPGNIRELENMMERAVLLSDSDFITPGDLPGFESSSITTVDESHIDDLGLKEYVRVYTSKLEKTRIQRTLQEEDWNVTRAAKKLEISRKSLQIKMKEYGLRDQAEEARRGNPES
jgi:two-component system response regulator AtoC